MNKEELKLVIANNIQKGWVSYGDFRTDVAVESILEALTEQLRIGGVIVPKGTVCLHEETYKKIRYGKELTKCKKCREILPRQNAL